MRLFRHNFVRNSLWALGLCFAALVMIVAVASGQKGSVSVTADGSLSGITVFVDAGHGGYDGGSRAKDSGVWEKGINLDVAIKTKQVLEQKGAKVIMSRETDVDLSDDKPSGITKKRQDLKRRLEIATCGKADFILSIHMNEYRNRAESGPHVFYRKGHDASRLLAGSMQQALIDMLKPTRERVAQAGDYYILSKNIPSVLIECGFISNAQEEKKLLNDAYQTQIALAIAQGLNTYLSLAPQ